MIDNLMSMNSLNVITAIDILTIDTPKNTLFTGPDPRSRYKNDTVECISILPSSNVIRIYSVSRPLGWLK